MTPRGPSRAHLRFLQKHLTLVMVLGSALIIIALANLTGGLSRTDSTTTGTVTGISEQHTAGRTLCRVHASFVIDDQAFLARTTRGAPRECDRAPGQVVTVRYLSEDPTAAYVTSGINATAWLVLAAGLGGVVGSGAAMVAQGSRRAETLSASR